MNVVCCNNHTNYINELCAQNVNGLLLKLVVHKLTIGLSIARKITCAQHPVMSLPVAGYCILFTFLASFSWLNVMCFDIWWTFRWVATNCV